MGPRPRNNRREGTSSGPLDVMNVGDINITILGYLNLLPNHVSEMDNHPKTLNLFVHEEEPDK
jgi:hypothetical protein